MKIVPDNVHCFKHACSHRMDELCPYCEQERLEKELQQARQTNTLFSLTGNSALSKKMAPEARIQKSGKPVTRDCYAAHMYSWRGGATPRRRGAE